MGQPSDHMYYLGECPVCSTGPLGLRRCGRCGGIVVLCDECDSVWPDAEWDRPPEPLSGEDLPCPHCGSSLLAPNASWATREEIEASDWLPAAIDERGLELQEGRAFTPRRNEPDADSSGADESGA